MSHHRHKQALIARLRELEDRLDGIEGALQAPHSRDWEDLAVEREDDEVLDRLGVTGAAEIARVREALRRLERGEYGTCLSCGGTISDRRLDAVPTATLCAACAGRVR